MSDTDLVKRISEQSSLEAFALSVLGLTEKDLNSIKEEKADKREYIRSMIETSDPSFGRFMTQAYQFYQGLRTSGKGDRKKLLKLADADAILKVLQHKVANLKVGEDLDDASLELCVLLYRLTRTKAE